MQLQFTVPLAEGTLLGNVRYRWIANGAYGAEQSAGITQPSGTWPLFVIDTAPPAGAEEIEVYDSANPDDNWTVGGYQIALLSAQMGTPITAPVEMTVILEEDADLGDVRYRWLANGVIGAELGNPGTDIIRPTIDRPLFVITALPPAGAQELIAYDSTAPGNWSTANYRLLTLSLPGAAGPGISGIRAANFRDDVLWAIARQKGEDPRTDLIDDEAEALVGFINKWVDKLYPLMDWPEWTLIEERTPDADHYIDFNQANKNPIGKPLRVYLRDPAVIAGPHDIAFRLNAKGIHVGFNHGTTVFLKFIKPAPKFTYEPWSSVPSYSAGYLVYDPTSGNCYSSKQAANQNHPVSDGTWWELVVFPVALVAPVVRGAYGEAMREEGQTEKAQTEEQGAMGETQESANRFIPSNFLTDQKGINSRYRIPVPAGGGAS